MPLVWSFSDLVQADPDAVFAWMTDYREDDHRSPAFLRGAGAKRGEASHRRILARTASEAEIEDTWKGRTFRLRAVFDKENGEVRITGGYGYEALWRAVPSGSGTRVEVEGRVAPPGMLRLLFPLFARGMRRELEQDFRGHLEDLRSSLGAARGG